jgi:predicted phage terminase large subunit-like protein
MDARDQAILKEHERRRNIQKSMVAWSRHCGYEPEPHHRLLIDEIEYAAKNGEARLIFCLPPGAAKSTYIVRLGVPWLLAQKVNQSVLGCSYSKDLIVGHARAARNHVEHNSKELGFSLKSDTRAADEWETTNGGRFFCAGTNAGIAGHRANLAFIDDPIGDDQDAQSQNYRDKQWSWYWDDFIPRLQPGGSVIIIANRRHEDDLVGRLIATEGTKWRHVKIPLVIDTAEQAQSDPLQRPLGGRLWPAYYTDLKLAEARKSKNFSGLYQQDPSPEDGDLIKSEHLVEYNSIDELPKDLKMYFGSDHALTEREENDSNCILPAGLDVRGDLWILPDIFWQQSDTLALVKRMIAYGRRYEVVQWFAENEHILKAIGPFLKLQMRKERVFIPMVGLTSSRDLTARSSSIRGMMTNKQVHFPAFAPWWHLARHQMLSFPKAKHDDFVSALAELGQGLYGMVKPSEPAPDPFVAEEPLTRLTMRMLKENHKRNQRPALYGGR